MKVLGSIWVPLSRAKMASWRLAFGERWVGWGLGLLRDVGDFWGFGGREQMGLGVWCRGFMEWIGNGSRVLGLMGRRGFSIGEETLSFFLSLSEI